MAPRSKLSPEQKAMVKMLYAKGERPRDIARRLCIGIGSVSNLCRSRASMAEKIELQRRQYSTLGAGTYVSRSVEIPKEVFDERDRRSELRRTMSITASVFGDPLPGYSALDRRT